MKIGIIDVDNQGKLNKCFPNIALMKISAFHKQQGDSVEFYDPMFSGRCDIVYMSKVFSFTNDYAYAIDANKIIKGGSGYAITNINGREVFDVNKHHDLPEEIEHIFPDYSLYGIKDTAYGFLSRGCPRGCEFCHVKIKEGLRSHKVADLTEFWNGQKFIELMDPNTMAAKEWREILAQLASSKAYVNFNQGVDIRLMNEEKIKLFQQVKIKGVHFAWDRYEDGPQIKRNLKLFKDLTGYDRHKVTVYILCNFNTSLDQDLERIYFVRSLGFSPYVMLYNKYGLQRGSVYFRLQRWVNNRFVFQNVERFEDYKQ